MCGAATRPENAKEMVEINQIKPKPVMPSSVNWCTTPRSNGSGHMVGDVGTSEQMYTVVVQEMSKKSNVQPSDVLPVAIAE